MSIIIERFIICDNCGNSFGVDNRSRSSREQRYNAKENGWLSKGNKDYCPTCKPLFMTPQSHTNEADK